MHFQCLRTCEKQYRFLDDDEEDQLAKYVIIFTTQNVHQNCCQQNQLKEQLGKRKFLARKKLNMFS